jgi:hypothetical protein
MVQASLLAWNISRGNNNTEFAWWVGWRSNPWCGHSQLYLGRVGLCQFLPTSLHKLIMCLGSVISIQNMPDKTCEVGTFRFMKTHAKRLKKVFILPLPLHAYLPVYYLPYPPILPFLTNEALVLRNTMNNLHIPNPPKFPYCKTSIYHNIEVVFHFALTCSWPRSKIKNRAVLSPPVLTRTSSSKLSENIISLVVVGRG